MAAMKQILVISALAVVLGGCSFWEIKKADWEISDNTDKVEREIKIGSAISKAPVVATIKEGMWLGDKPIRLHEQDILPPIFYARGGIREITPMSLNEAMEILSTEMGMRISITPDAEDHLRNMESGVAESVVSQSDDATSMGADGEQIRRESGRGLPGKKLKFSFDHFGTWSSSLDYVTSKVGLFWAFDGATIKVLRHDVRTFTLDAMPGTAVYKTEVSTGATNQANGGSHQTLMNAAPASAWDSTVLGMKELLSKDGKMSFSEQLGTVTIRDTPAVLRRIEEHLDNLNAIATSQIGIRTEVYEVTLHNEQSIGVDWAAQFSGSNSTSAVLNTLFSGGIAPNLELGVLDSDRYGGTKAFISALSQIGNVSLVTTSTNFTLNGQPVPVKIGQELDYIKKISRETSTSSSGSVGFTIETATVQDGFYMTLVPRIASDGRVMMQVSTNITVADVSNKEGFDELKVALPKRDVKDFTQRIVLRSGQTMMAAGFERTISTSGEKSLGGEGTWLIGGNRSGSQKRVMTMLLVTPYLMTK